MKGLFNLLQTASLYFLSSNDLEISPNTMMCILKSKVNDYNLDINKVCNHFSDYSRFRDSSLNDECKRFMNKDYYPESIYECSIFLEESLGEENDEIKMEKWSDFIDYMIEYKKYYTNMNDVYERFDIFHDNLEFIHQHNDEGNHSYKLGINQFADWSHDEFKNFVHQGSLGGLMKTTCPMSKDQTGTLASSVDWRQKGIVNAIQNQKSCGSCFTFSTIASIEGADAQKTGKLQKYAEQAIVDCAGLTYGDMGCNGGTIEGSFNFVHDYGVTLESSYPYTAVEGKCQSYTPLAKNTGCYEIPKNELQITYAVSQRVISIAIQADGRSFQLYKSGVYDDPNCYQGQLDHAVNLVGYGHDSSSGKDYYILRNSWDTTYGMDGYVWMARNSVASSTTGMCGLALMGSYPYY